MISGHAAGQAHQWRMIAVFVDPMVIIGVSVVNRVSSMTDDVTVDAAKIDLAPR